MYAATTLWTALEFDIHLLPFDALKKVKLFVIFLFLRCVSTVIIVYIIISPLNSYLYIHWILDFKKILLLLLSITRIRIIRKLFHACKIFHNRMTVNRLTML